jgi:hypothetical protein
MLTAGEGADAALMTVRKGAVKVGDVSSALAQAEYLEDELDSPGAFGDNAGDLTAPSLSDGATSSFWFGTPAALERMEVKLGAPVQKEVMALALQGFSAGGEQVRQAGHGRVTTPEVHFSLKDPALLWAAADGDPELRAKFEHIVLKAACQTVSYLVGTKDVMFIENGEEGHTYAPAGGFVASATLHVTSRIAEGEIVPSPTLGVHVKLIGAERADGSLATVDSNALFCNGTPVEGGAVFRSLVAQELRALGFGIRACTGKKGRFFEIEGITQAVRDAASGRARQVERERAAIEEQLGRPLINVEAAALALKDRRGKDPKQSREFIRATWRVILVEQGGLTLERVWKMRRERQLQPLGQRLAEARGVALQRFRERGPTVTIGEANAIVVEAGVATLSIRECNNLLTDMQRSGELIALTGGFVTTREVRELEQRVMERILRAASRGGVAASADALAMGLARANEHYAPKGFKLEGPDGKGGQAKAASTLCSGVRIGILHGRAGTGKGPVLRAITEVRYADGWEVIAAGADGRTQGEMTKHLEHTGLEARTLAGLIGEVGRGDVTLTPRTVIIIDECSKVSLDDWDTVTSWLEEYDVELILAGHLGQHDAVEQPGMFTEMVLQRDPAKAVSDVLITSAELTDIRRHDPEWQTHLQIAVDDAEGVEALRLLKENDAIAISETPEEAMLDTVKEWDEERRAYEDPQATIMVVSGSNDDVDRLNKLAQERRRQSKDRKELGDQSVAAVDRNYRIYEGDLVIIAAAPYRFPKPPGGEAQKRVANGTIGVVTGVDQERDIVRVRFDEPDMDREVEIDQADLRKRMGQKKSRKTAALRLAYAHHTFPIQGATVEQVFFCAVTMPSKNGFYVGITRQHMKLRVRLHRMVRGEQASEEEVEKALVVRISTEERRKSSLGYKQILTKVASMLPRIVAPYPHEQQVLPIARDPAPLAAAAARIARDQATILGRLHVAFGTQRTRRFEAAARTQAEAVSELDYARLQETIEHGWRALAELNGKAAKAWSQNLAHQQPLANRIAESQHEAEVFDARASAYADSRDKRDQSRRDALKNVAATHRESAVRDQEKLTTLGIDQRKIERRPDSPAAWLDRNREAVITAIAAEHEQQSRVEKAASKVVEVPAVEVAVQAPEVAV